MNAPFAAILLGSLGGRRDRRRMSGFSRNVDAVAEWRALFDSPGYDPIACFDCIAAGRPLRLMDRFGYTA